MGFPSILRSTRQWTNGAKLGNCYSYFSYKVCAFFPSDSRLMVYFITWEMHGVSYQFLIAWEDAVKPTLLWRSGVKIPIFFPKHGWFSSIIFPCYGILQHVKNAWVFTSISHSMDKCSKICPMVWSWSWEPLLHQIPIIWVVYGFSNEFLVLWLNSANRTYYMVRNWSITPKILKNTISTLTAGYVSYSHWLAPRHFVRATSQMFENFFAFVILM